MSTYTSPAHYQYLLVAATPSQHNSLINGYIYSTYIKKIEITENSGLTLTPQNVSAT